MIYIDPLFDTKGLSEKWPFDETCHMMADSVEELIQFARKLKLKDKWIQCTYLVHYDLTKNKRYQAIKLGAQVVDAGFMPENYRAQKLEFENMLISELRENKK